MATLLDTIQKFVESKRNEADVPLTDAQCELAVMLCLSSYGTGQDMPSGVEALLSLKDEQVGELSLHEFAGRAGALHARMTTEASGGKPTEAIMASLAEAEIIGTIGFLCDALAFPVGSLVFGFTKDGGPSVRHASDDRLSSNQGDKAQPGDDAQGGDWSARG
jgi:hypothetical protein